MRYPRSGSRGYLCVAGGINVPEVLGSRSTALRGGFGGVEGRPLEAGDRLPSRPATYKPLPEGGVGIEPPELALRDVFAAPVKGIVPVRAIPSGEYALFAADHLRFWQQPRRFPAKATAPVIALPVNRFSPPVRLRCVLMG